MPEKPDALALVNPAAVAISDPEKLALLKRTVCKGSSNDEFDLFVAVCKSKKLDPFSQQICAVMRWNSDLQRKVMTIQTQIDGFRVIAERTGKYAGSDEPVYDTEDAKHPNKATVTVWKIVGNLHVSFTATARWDEYVAMKKGGGPNVFWANKPYLMLAKCAEALALRKAFPNDLSGLYTEDEMMQAENDGEVIDVDPVDQGKPGDSDRFQKEIAAKAESRGGTPSSEPAKEGGLSQDHLERLSGIVEEFHLAPKEMLELAQSVFGDRIKGRDDLSPKDYQILCMKFDRVRAHELEIVTDPAPARFEEMQDKVEPPKQDLSSF